MGTADSNPELNSELSSWINTTTPATALSYMATTDTPTTFSYVAIPFTAAFHSAQVTQSTTTKLAKLSTHSPAEMNEIAKTDFDIPSPASVSMTSLKASTSNQTLNASKRENLYQLNSSPV